MLVSKITRERGLSIKRWKRRVRKDVDVEEKILKAKEEESSEEGRGRGGVGTQEHNNIGETGTRRPI